MVSRGKVFLTLLLAMTAVAACGNGQLAPSTKSAVTGPSGDSYRVYLQTVQDSAPAIAAITIPGGKRSFVANAVLSADGRVAYSVLAQGTDTVVRALNAQTGEEKAEQTIKGSYSYQLPTPDANPVPSGLSPNGRWLVLERQIPAPYQATPNNSRFAVVSTDLKETPRQFDFEGWYRFDAIDNSGDSVYLLEYLPSGKGAYQVRRFDLAKGALDPTVIADKTELGQPMNGVRVAGFYSTDGGWHLGIYGRSTGEAFLHALPLSASTPFAFCVDLPAKSSGLMVQMGWSAVETRDGRTLYLANEQLQEVLEIEIPPAGRFEEPKVTRRASLPLPTALRLPGIVDAQAKELSSQRLVLSKDGRSLYLGSAHGIYVIDASSLTVRSRWLYSTAFGSLVGTTDGSRLFGAVIAGTAQLDQIDPGTGKLISQTEVPLTVLGLDRAMRSSET